MQGISRIVQCAMRFLHPLLHTRRVHQAWVFSCDHLMPRPPPLHNGPEAIASI